MSDNILKELSEIISGTMVYTSKLNGFYNEILLKNNIEMIDYNRESFYEEVLVKYKDLYFLSRETDTSYGSESFGDWIIVVPKTIVIYEPAN